MDQQQFDTLTRTLATRQSRRRVLGLFTGGLAVAVGGGAHAVLAKPGTSTGSPACLSGGYLNYTDANGRTFRSEGQCSRYTAKGGTLTPVVVTTPVPTPDPTSTASVSLTFSGNTGGDAIMTLTGSGLRVGSMVTLDLYKTDGTTLLGWYVGDADGAGNYSQNMTIPCNYLASVMIRGVAPDGSSVSDTETPIC
jgi:hypothetical protein